MTMQMREEAEAERMAQDEQERRDWFEMMQSEAAFRVFLGLLDEMGANRVMVTENDATWRIKFSTGSQKQIPMPTSG